MNTYTEIEQSKYETLYWVFTNYSIWILFGVLGLAILYRTRVYF